MVNSGVHNINLVTADHFWPHAWALIQELRREDRILPVVMNSSGYHSPDRIAEYSKTIDIFLPDFKFADPNLAETCMGDARYPQIALASLLDMVNSKGFLHPWDPSGSQPAQTGVLVRHLVLPGMVANSLAVLRLLHKTFGHLLPISLMSQFKPTPGCQDRPPFNRALRSSEYDEVLALVHELDMQNVYVQELSDDMTFVPDFNQAQPFG